MTVSNHGSDSAMCPDWAKLSLLKPIMTSNALCGGAVHCGGSNRSCSGRTVHPTLLNISLELSAQYLFPGSSGLDDSQHHSTPVL